MFYQKKHPLEIAQELDSYQKIIDKKFTEFITSPNERDMKCPCCKGKGEIKSPKNPKEYLALRRQMAREMREEGFTLQYIAKVLEYKSWASVVLACNRKD
jgi:hypothetical protein